jgi:hypothetical protein
LSAGEDEGQLTGLGHEVALGVPEFEVFFVVAVDDVAGADAAGEPARCGAGAYMGGELEGGRAGDAQVQYGWGGAVDEQRETEGVGLTPAGEPDPELRARVAAGASLPTSRQSREPELHLVGHGDAGQRRVPDRVDGRLQARLSGGDPSSPAGKVGVHLDRARRSAPQEERGDRERVRMRQHLLERAQADGDVVPAVDDALCCGGRGGSRLIAVIGFGGIAGDSRWFGCRY